MSGIPTTNPRANRFRKIVSQSILVPPPLPLIHLPEESRLARTGLPGERPLNLPIRRHLPNKVALASLKATADGRSVDFDNLPPPKAEPILRESKTLLECEADEYQELEVLARLHVYEYNQPSVFRDSSAPDDTLVFDSLFESGNLQRAERIIRKAPSGTSAHEYELLIHPDVKNGAYRQWFYFEVRNGRPGVTYRFSLVNLAKSGALFGQGLQPVVYSEQDAATKGLGWRHRGTHVRYDVAVSSMAPPGANALTFQYEFENENDSVYFACIQPYTYTDLMDYLEELERDPVRSQTCRRTELCQSLAGNSCDLLSITSSGKEGLPHDDRRIIIVSARVHPGESNSSWMMQGMLDYLTGSSSGAMVLRRHFIFKVVPMLNPDGVINGNTRVSLAGWDLNRKWGNPVEQLFPSVYHLKQQIAHFQTRERVAIYCDLHGHSINRNIFTYGCYSSKKKPSSSEGTKASTQITPVPAEGNGTGVKTDPRVFPMIVARHAPCFSFTNCDFSIHKSKATTARVVVHQELGVMNSYTLEASFCGPDFGVRKDTQFSTWDLEEMGRSWCQSLLVYYGLTSQVKELDAERAKRLALDQQQQESPSPNRRNSPTRAKFALVRGEVQDEESRLARDLLLDCEAAISALFAHSGVDSNGREGSDDDHDVGELDSDLSGAEEEPIPPTGSTEDNEPPCSPRAHSERKKQHDDAEATDDEEEYESAPEETSTEKNRTSDGHTRKKTARRKHKRGGASSKTKPVVGTTGRKNESKSKRKKKPKGKPELRRTVSTSAPPLAGPKSEDAAAFTAPFVESVADPEIIPKPLMRKGLSTRRINIRSARPRSSSEAPKSVSSAILQATMNVDLAASRANLRLCPIPTYPSTPSDTLLMLPSVSGGSSRSINVAPRILKTAPGCDQDYPVVNEKSHFNLARIRSELPALQLSGRDEELRRRASLRLKFRRQENDDRKSDEDSDASSERSEPESYASRKLLDLVSIPTN